MSGRPVTIPRPLLEEIYAHAREVFPAECCGFLVGPAAAGASGSGAAAVTKVRTCTNAQAVSDHPIASERTPETAYVIAGEDLLALARSFDGPEPARVIYHSHPNGRAYFSAVDHEVAVGPWDEGPMYPVQQLVIGVSAARVVESKLFDWDDERKAFVEVARFSGDAE